MLIYNATFVLFVVVLFVVLAAFALSGLLERQGRRRMENSTLLTENTQGLNYFPKFVANRGLVCYVATLLLVSAIFLNHVLPFQFVVFGFVSVFVFFSYSTSLSQSWRKFAPQLFTKKLFSTALAIRIIYVVFIYFYYVEMTGEPFAYFAGDEKFYYGMGSLWRLYGLDEFLSEMREFVPFSDSGYSWWLAIEYQLMGVNVLPTHLLKCLIDAFSCVLLYNLADRNFGDAAARMTAIFYMLLPNAWYYCGVTLKETEMFFLVMLFAERSDMVLRSPKITLKEMILPLMCIIIMFTFRTAMGGVMFAAMVGALILSSSKQMQAWKKVLYGSLFAVWMFLTVGVEIVQETRDLWEGRAQNQSVGYEWRSETNAYAKYATATVFAPLIFTIPFSSMVNVIGQENQMMLNGANFIKNIMSGFTIFAILLLITRGKWREHVLPLALTCGYLVVLVFSNFAHSERFHFPVLGLEMMFAAYGITQMTNKHKRWFNIWTIVICVANVLWALIKLKGRGLA